MQVSHGQFVAMTVCNCCYALKKLFGFFSTEKLGRVQISEFALQLIHEIWCLQYISLTPTSSPEHS